MDLSAVQNQIINKWLVSSDNYSFSIRDSTTFDCYYRHCRDILVGNNFMTQSPLVIYSLSTGKGYFEALMVVQLLVEFPSAEIVLLVDDPFSRMDANNGVGALCLLQSNRLSIYYDRDIDDFLLTNSNVHFIVGVQVQVSKEFNEVLYHYLKKKNDPKFETVVFQMEYTLCQQKRFRRLMGQEEVKPVLVFFMPRGPTEFEDYYFDSFMEAFT